MVYTSDNIVHVKNIKRRDGNGWAYADVTCDETFILSWTDRSADTPSSGDLIVLFQRPNEINGRRNHNVHLTHLVKIVSDELLIDEDNSDFRYGRQVQLIAKADPIDKIPNPGDLSFFLPNRGRTNPIINLESKRDLTESELKAYVWTLFADHFCPYITVLPNKEGVVPEIHGALEGDKVIRNHVHQEITIRNTRIVQEKKRLAFESGNGHVRCECCQFDFIDTYGKLGKGFIECHHKIFIANGQRVTKMEDLALVCANCHRMLHRKNDDDEYYSVEELRRLMNNLRK